MPSLYPESSDLFNRPYAELDLESCARRRERERQERSEFDRNRVVGAALALDDFFERFPQIAVLIGFTHDEGHAYCQVFGELPLPFAPRFSEQIDEGDLSDEACGLDAAGARCSEADSETFKSFLDHRLGVFQDGKMDLTRRFLERVRELSRPGSRALGNRFYGAITAPERERCIAGAFDECFGENAWASFRAQQLQAQLERQIPAAPSAPRARV